MSHHTPLAYESCKVPLRRIQVFGVWLTVHEGIVGDCYEAERRWKALGGREWFEIRQADTGSYNCRNSVGHSRAVAIDFNWQSNPYRKPRPSSGCPQQPRMREFYEKCWRPLGYGWGGNWSSACDAMHVSKLVNEGGDGRLYATSASGNDPKEDNVATRPTLRRGDKGEAVRQMQETLIQIGYPLPEFGADRDFGAETEAAVNKFKTAHKIANPKVMDQPGWDRLLSVNHYVAKKLDMPRDMYDAQKRGGGVALGPKKEPAPAPKPTPAPKPAPGGLRYFRVRGNTAVYAVSDDLGLVQHVPNSDAWDALGKGSVREVAPEDVHAQLPVYGS